jgi:hypothetical protein
MNRQKIVVAGLAAGLVLNVLDFVIFNYLTGGALKAALDAVNPSLSAAMASSPAVVVGIIMDFLLGIILVWLYAAMRPRYGAGPRNALMAAFFVWLVSALMASMMHTMGLMSAHLFLLICALELINLSIAGLVGGKLYSE